MSRLTRLIPQHVGRWLFALVAIAAVSSEASAGDLLPVVSNFATPATALSLALVTAAIKSQK